MLPFSPTVNCSLVTTEETWIAATGYLADMAHGDVLNEDGRVLATHWIVYAQLAELIVAHRVDIIIIGDEASMAITASH